MKKLIVAGYLILVHLLLAVVIWKSDFINRVNHTFGITTPSQELSSYYYRLVQYHSRMDGNIPELSVIFIGDSITQGLAVSAIAQPAVNYGIGGDTTVGVLSRLSKYNSIASARMVVIAVGINDMTYRGNEEILTNYKKIAGRIPKSVPIVFSAVLPIDEQDHTSWSGKSQKRINELNRGLQRWTDESETTFFIDAGSRLTDEEGNLADQYHDGDGLHLNSLGNQIWIEELNKAVSTVGNSAEFLKD